MSAVLVLPHDAPEADWLAARRQGVGASEIAAVMGISPWDSPFSLFWRKRLGWEVEANPEMRTGTYLEPTIAQWFADRHPEYRVAPAGLFRSSDRPWQLATPDRLLFGEPFGMVRALECKWASSSWDGWGAEGTDDVPVHYRAQCLQQLDVLDVDQVHLAALGPGGFREYLIRRDERDLAGMREAGHRFIQAVASGEAPDVDGHAATLPILRRLHADIEDREQEIPAHIVEGWLRSRRFLELAERCKARYTAQLRQHLGTAKTAVLDGRKIASRTTNDQLRRAA